MYCRSSFSMLLARLNEPRRFIQIVAGPRQVGKTTMAQQVAGALNQPYHYASADNPALKGPAWIAQQWETAKLKVRESGQGNAVLFIDEIQKLPHWSEQVKSLWDEDTAEDVPLRVVLLGSSPLLLQRDLTESLAGRFEIIPATHWSFTEMREAFGWNLEQYLYFGGYPGAAELIDDENRWAAYINDSLIETSISRDVLLLARVDKPALLRQLFHLGCEYSGQILSFHKMLGQLQDAGSTTTLSHYLSLLGGAGMLTGIQKYAGQQVRRRGSSPKLNVLNTALISAQRGSTFKQTQANTGHWGRLVESAVGAHLLNNNRGSGIKVYYWRERNREVDFILERERELVAIEVKSSRNRDTIPGIQAFSNSFHPKHTLLVGHHGIPLETFLTQPITGWFS